MIRIRLGGTSKAVRARAPPSPSSSESDDESEDDGSQRHGHGQMASYVHPRSFLTEALHLKHAEELHWLQKKMQRAQARSEESIEKSETGSHQWMSEAMELRSTNNELNSDLKALQKRLALSKSKLGQARQEAEAAREELRRSQVAYIQQAQASEERATRAAEEATGARELLQRVEARCREHERATAELQTALLLLKERCVQLTATEAALRTTRESERALDRRLAGLQEKHEQLLDEKTNMETEGQVRVAGVLSDKAALELKMEGKNRMLAELRSAAAQGLQRAHEHALEVTLLRREASELLALKVGNAQQLEVTSSTVATLQAERAASQAEVAKLTAGLSAADRELQRAEASRQGELLRVQEALGQQRLHKAKLEARLDTRDKEVAELTMRVQETSLREQLAKQRGVMEGHKADADQKQKAQHYEDHCNALEAELTHERAGHKSALKSVQQQAKIIEDLSQQLEEQRSLAALSKERENGLNKQLKRLTRPGWTH